MSGSAAPDPRAAARQVLEAHWRQPGFTCPNDVTYPWLWLWDSCFHAIVWAELGDDERALTELRTALSAQDDEGFVPHLLYLDGSSAHAAFWGRPATSSITQPPVYALAVVELERRAITVPDDLRRSAVAGLRFLLERRRRSPAGLVEIVHPWESGCDHSPRWDAAMVPGSGTGGDPYDERHWFDRKGDLLVSVHRSPGGAPLWNDEFAIGSVAFTAIVAHGARVLGDLVDDPVLLDDADELAAALVDRWDPDRRTWVDDGPTAASSGRIRTLEALLPLLVDRRDHVSSAVVAELDDPAAFGGAYGPAQVHRGEPRYRRGSYWRGPSWPQLDFLMAVALGGVGETEAAARLATTTLRGAVASGWAEYWDPDDASPGGAVPQSWSTLAICMVDDR